MAQRPVPEWFAKNRLGLFIHWGLYALDGWHEQMQWRAHVSRTAYEPLLQRFNPTDFSPDEWIDLAEVGGMTSLCFTTKHHDGFCLWDTKQTDFKVTNSPYGKDVLAELAEACHRRGMKLRLYYSVVDWHHPNYPTHGSHHELPEPAPHPDRKAYMHFLEAQVEELCTHYGEIHGFWWDMNTMQDHDPGFTRPEINDRIRQWQPLALINDRGFDNGDFGTPERDKEIQDGSQRPLEACQSVGALSWGWREKAWHFTRRHLLWSLDRCLAMGGNYLLNVGPLPDGRIPEKSAERIRAVGEWYDRVKDAFDATRPAPCLLETKSLLVTTNDKSVYVHCTDIPVHDGADLAPLDTMPKSARLLNDGRDITAALELLPSRWSDGKETLFLYDLPVEDFPHEPLIIWLEW